MGATHTIIDADNAFSQMKKEKRKAEKPLKKCVFDNSHNVIRTERGDFCQGCGAYCTW
jgi:hypothetical protein